MRALFAAIVSVGMLGVISTILIIIAVRSYQSNQVKAEELALRSQDRHNGVQEEMLKSEPKSTSSKKGLSPSSESETRKSSSGAHATAPGLVAISKNLQPKRDPVFDPAFENAWAECVKVTNQYYINRDKFADNILKKFSTDDRLDAQKRMVIVDLRPYAEMPIQSPMLHHYFLIVWMMRTSAQAAIKEEEFKIVAAGIWSPSVSAKDLMSIAGYYGILSPALRSSIAESFRKKVPPSDLPPRVRLEIIEMGAEAWVGRRTFDQVWADLQAAAEKLEEEQGPITEHLLTKVPPESRAGVADFLRSVRADPTLAASPVAVDLIFRHHFSYWHQAMRTRAAVSSDQYYTVAKILWESGVEWKDLYTFTRQLYLETLPIVDGVQQAIISNVKSELIHPLCREFIAENGGKKWLNR